MSLSPKTFAKFSCKVIVLVTVLLQLGCIGYRFGSRTLIRPDVATVYLPVIESEVLRQGIDVQLTEAIAKEIEARTHLKLVPAYSSDSVLSGRIVHERKLVAAEDAFDQPRDNQVQYVIEFTWIDRFGNHIMQFSTISVPNGMLTVSQRSNFIPEAGQSYATTQTEIVQRLARQIVSQMEFQW